MFLKLAIIYGGNMDDMNLLILTFAVFLLNVPFGYWRKNTARFSIQWFLSIHIPIPIVAAFRVFAGIGGYLLVFPVLLTAFFLGQLAGGKMHSLFVKYSGTRASSCIFLDLVKIVNIYRANKGRA
jgi:hypothetical protein